MPTPASTLTPTQVRTAQAIVNIFETSQVRGNYSQVTLLPGDTGRLSYGRSQATLGSGNLAMLLRQYCDNPAARFATLLRTWLPAIDSADPAVDQDQALHNLLRTCADDVVMRDTQDSFFDAAYWRPALARARSQGINLPLGVAIVYDSSVHGSWARLRDRTTEAAGALPQIGERPWLEAYVRERRDWLAHHPRPDLRPTVYRMDAFQRLLDLGQDGLALPLVVRGIEISEAALAAPAPFSYDGPVPGARSLRLRSPLLRGHDVRRVQLALSLRGVDLIADGVYGQATALRIRQYQQAHGRPANGIATAALIAELVG